MDSRVETSEAKLQKLVAEYRAIVDASRDALFVHDRDFRITKANKTYATWAGKTFKEIIGRRYWEIYPPIEGPMHVCEKLADARPEQIREEALMLPDGGTVYTRVFPIFDESGKPYACMHIFVDVATTKALQHALDESRERLDLALASAAAGTWEWSVPADRIVWDCCLKPTPERGKRQFVGTLQQSLDFIHADDRDGLRRALQAAIQSDDAFQREFRMQAEDGAIRYVALQCRVHRDEAGQPLRMVGLCRDITPRREAERQNRWLAEIVRSANAAIIGLSPEGTILSWNDAAVRMYGYAAEEVLGESLMIRVVPPHARAEVTDYFERAKRGERLTYEAQRQSSDGTKLWLAITLSPVFDAESMLRGVSASILDITQQKRAEEERSEGLIRLHKTLLGTIEAISATLEFRDPYTAGHQHRVGDLAVSIATRLGWSEERIEGLRLGAFVHDIGKIAVPAEILTRPGKLTKAEYEIIKEHPRVGADILRKVDLPWPIMDMVLHHHERLDGSGYPDGLRGNQISREARVLAVADVVEAMSSHRPYRPGLGMQFALDELRKNRGKLYDPEAVDACLAVVAAGEFQSSDDE